MSLTPKRALHLLNTSTFTTPTHALTRAEKTKLAYERAKETVRAYRTYPLRVIVGAFVNNRLFTLVGLTIDDVLTLSPKFWEIHQDPIMALDGGAMTLITIQVNLTSGTIARQAVHRPELIPLVDDLLNYRKQYVRCIR